ncbi:hypothetical protein Lser_V15G37583 [Lactuca serriola]
MGVTLGASLYGEKCASSSADGIENQKGYGVVSRHEALERARRHNVDLVE